MSEHEAFQSADSAGQISFTSSGGLSYEDDFKTMFCINARHSPMVWVPEDVTASEAAQAVLDALNHQIGQLVAAETNVLRGSLEAAELHMDQLLNLVYDLLSRKPEDIANYDIVLVAARFCLAKIRGALGRAPSQSSAPAPRQSAD